ncbi:complement C1q-like protein 3 [Mytilus trossulus]|uniref:complement C1q-like protein 3 n=1 Tax=Mytilus trossulus TaxID=6551 RepID=UPI003005D4E5
MSMKCVCNILMLIAMMIISNVQASCKKESRLSEDLMDMMCKIRKPRIDNEPHAGKRDAFTVSLTKGTNLAANEVIKFDKVWLNTGKIYDSSTGVFTVKKTGLYLVSGSVMSFRGKQLHCHLWKNNESTVGTYGHNYSQGSLNAVMELKRGDKLTIRHDGHAGTEGLYGMHWSMFSAYIISE